MGDFYDKIKPVNMRLLFSCIMAVLPAVACADTFTTDKRTYVTNAQWQSTPYKHVLAMFDNEGGVDTNYCTANMVRGKILTARHCLGDNVDSSTVYTFRAYDGTRLHATVENYGGYVGAVVAENNPGDWAILKPSDASAQRFVSDNSIHNFPSATSGRSGTVYALGFGGLKIMSDQEISSFREAYLYYLRNFSNSSSMLIDIQEQSDSIDMETRTGTGFYVDLYCSQNNDARGTRYNGGTCSGTKYEEKFNGVSFSWLNDTARLKNGTCRYSYNEVSPDGTYQGLQCQFWGGNSGGGVYLPRESGYLIGIQTRAGNLVGGRNHSARGLGTIVSSDVFKSAFDK